MLGTFVAYRMMERENAGSRDATSRGYRAGQIGSASLVSLAHGTTDAQKTMGVITLGPVAHGTLTQHGESAPSVRFWVNFVAAGSVAA